MSKRKVTIANLKKVMDKLVEFALEDKSNGRFICRSLNEMLDDLASNDFFGTEGQCDPRGDQRD